MNIFSLLLQIKKQARVSKGIYIKYFWAKTVKIFSFFFFVHGFADAVALFALFSFVAVHCSLMKSHMYWSCKVQLHSAAFSHWAASVGQAGQLNSLAQRLLDQRCARRRVCWMLTWMGKYILEFYFFKVVSRVYFDVLFSLLWQDGTLGSQVNIENKVYASLIFSPHTAYRAALCILLAMYLAVIPVHF